MQNDHDDGHLVDDVTRVTYEGQKAVVGAATAVATIGAEVLAAGVLHGGAQTIVQAIVAGLGVLGIHQSVYRTENKPKV